MLDWNDYRKQLAAGVKEIGQLSPDTITGYMGLSAAGQKTDPDRSESPRVHRSRGGRHLVLRRLHYGAYRGRNQTWGDQGRDCGSARSRHDRQRRGGACLLRTRDGCVQGISERCLVARTGFPRQSAVNPAIRRSAGRHRVSFDMPKTPGCSSEQIGVVRPAV